MFSLCFSELHGQFLSVLCRRHKEWIWGSYSERFWFLNAFKHLSGRDRGDSGKIHDATEIFSYYIPKIPL